jgi:hypothetical protein
VSDGPWAEAPEAEGLADALRSSLDDKYVAASNEQMNDALMEMLDSMSPAEALNFGSALGRIGKSASQLIADPTFRQVASAALPIVGGLVGGPVGAGLGSLAAGALAGPAPTAAAPRSAPAPARATPVSAPAAAPAAAPGPTAPVSPTLGVSSLAAAGPAVAAIPSAPAPVVPAIPPSATAPSLPPSVAGGSHAAKQCLVLTHQRDVLQALLATALGQHGRLEVSGIPVARLLAMLSEMFAQAAADADELMYLGQQAEPADSTAENDLAGSFPSLYRDLVGADDLEIAEAARWEELD